MKHGMKEGGGGKIQSISNTTNPFYDLIGTIKSGGKALDTCVKRLNVVCMVGDVGRPSHLFRNSVQYVLNQQNTSSFLVPEAQNLIPTP